MRQVDVKFLRPGQVLADRVCNAAGAVLCPLGYTLTEQAIERLENARIESVWIEGSAKPPVDVTESLAQLDRRFNGVEDPVLLEIRALIRRRYERFLEEYGG